MEAAIESAEGGEVGNERDGGGIGENVGQEEGCENKNCCTDEEEEMT